MWYPLTLDVLPNSCTRLITYTILNWSVCGVCLLLFMLSFPPSSILIQAWMAVQREIATTTQEASMMYNDKTPLALKLVESMWLVKEKTSKKAIKDIRKKLRNYLLLQIRLTVKTSWKRYCSWSYYPYIFQHYEISLGYATLTFIYHPNQ